MIVVLLSFFSEGGFTTVVLFSFFSAGGFVTVVSFCSQAANSAKLASMQTYFFIQVNRIAAPRVTPLSLKIKEHKRSRTGTFSRGSPHAKNLNFYRSR